MGTRSSWITTALGLLLVMGCPQAEPGDDDTTEDGDDDTDVVLGGVTDTDEQVDFGYVEVGFTGQIMLEVRNAGFAPLEITAVVVAGAEHGVFTVDFPGTVVLPPDEPTVYMPLDLTFTPPAAGPHDAWLMLFSSDVDLDPGEPFLVPLLGAGKIDADGDGYFDGETYHEIDADCDDSDDGVYPGAPEACDGVDNDCSGGPGADETDLDADGFMPCEDDCDDDDPARYPGATELCNGLDDDCDGGVPDDEADLDGDGFAACEGDCDDNDPTSTPADLDGDGYPSCGGDCDDEDPLIHPGATELCDGLDGDCDGTLPIDEQDGDGDGMSSCEGDCDDADAAMHGHDLDGDGASPCDGDCDDADALLNALDLDGDGHTTCGGDCADDDAAVHPAAFDDCDGVDNDCDGVADNPPDVDGDGAGICDEYPDCDDGDATVHPAWVAPGVVGGLGTVSQPFGSIQSAVSVENCGTVLLREGVYQEGATVLIDHGPVGLVSVDGPRMAVLDGGSSHELLEITVGPVTLDGLVLQNGVGAFAGCITSEADLNVYNCVVQGNEADYLTLGVGAIYVAGAALDVDSSEFYLNRGWAGAISAWNAEAVVTDSVFGANGGGLGNFGPGGVLMAGGQLTVDGSLFFENLASAGAGIGALSATSVHLIDSTFEWNECNFHGCGVSLDGVASFEIEGCTFENNWNDYGDGGALHVEGSDGTVRNSTFLDNDALGSGGAIWHRDAVLDVEQSLFLANQATEGGGILLDGGEARISNCIFNSNAGDGAAISSDLAVLSLVNNTYFDNRASQDQGAVKLTTIPATLEIQNNLFFGYTEFAFDCDGTIVGFDYNCLEADSPPRDSSPTCTLVGTGDIYAVNNFYSAIEDLDPMNDDLHLLVVHPAIDSGNPDMTYNDPDGSRNDIGAFGGPDAMP